MVDNEGNVKNTKIIDREEFGASNFFEVTFEAQEVDCYLADELCKTNGTTSIQIIDVDDNDPKITAPITNLTIKEDGNLNDLSGVSVLDLDSDIKFSKYHLEIVSDVEAAKEQIILFPSDSSGNTSEVIFQVKPSLDESIFDYETRQELKFDLKVTGGVYENRTHQVSFTINIEDVNDNVPTFEKNSYNISLFEDLSNLQHDNNGQVIIASTIKATDADGSPEFGQDSIRYALSTNLELNIDEITGIISMREGINPFDYESTKEITLTVLSLT